MNMHPKEFSKHRHKVHDAPWKYATMWPCGLLGDFGWWNCHSSDCKAL